MDNKKLNNNNGLSITNEDYIKIIEHLIDDNNKKNILIINLQRRINNLETQLFSASVPPPSTSNTPKTIKPKKKPLKKHQAPSPQPNSVVIRKPGKLKVLFARTLQGATLFGGRFIKNEIAKKKLKKLSRNPYAYFADSKHKFLRPLRNLFEQP